MYGIAGYIGEIGVDEVKIFKTLDIQVLFADIRQATFINEVLA
jgi:hypothetical protein